MSRTGRSMQATAPPRRHSTRRSQGGFLLVPVVLALTVIATITCLGTREAAVNASITSAQAQADQLRYAAEAALAHQAQQITAANCGAMPNVPNTALGTTGYSYDAVTGRSMDANSLVYNAVARDRHVPASFTSGYVELDVTSKAQAWVSSPSTNFGVILRNTATTDVISLASDEASSNSPDLVVTDRPR